MQRVRQTKPNLPSILGTTEKRLERAHTLLRTMSVEMTLKGVDDSSSTVKTRKHTARLGQLGQAKRQKSGLYPKPSP